jgi:hypothetical protein
MVVQMMKRIWSEVRTKCLLKRSRTSEEIISGIFAAGLAASSCSLTGPS